MTGFQKSTKQDWFQINIKKKGGLLKLKITDSKKH